MILNDLCSGPILKCSRSRRQAWSPRVSFPSHPPSEVGSVALASTLGGTGRCHCRLRWILVILLGPSVIFLLGCLRYQPPELSWGQKAYGLRQRDTTPQCSTPWDLGRDLLPQNHIAQNPKTPIDCISFGLIVIQNVPSF